MYKYAKEVNECLSEIRQGNTDQLEQLINITASHLRAVAIWYLVNKDLVEDVLNEAYVNVFRYIASYDVDKDGYNWLCKIVQNVAANHNKREGKTAEAEQKYYLGEPSEYWDPEYDNVDFYLVLGKLSETDRFVVYHRFFLGESLREIGEKLNVSKTAVFQRINKIKKFIEENLKKG